jgi:hypothetical protein
MCGVVDITDVLTVCLFGHLSRCLAVYLSAFHFYTYVRLYIYLFLTISICLTIVSL